MAQINFGGTLEEVVTREEFPMEKALKVLQDETIAIIGYGVQGPAQALNLRDNGFNVIVGQRKGSKTWDKAISHGWVPGETLFEIEEAVKHPNFVSRELVGTMKTSDGNEVKYIKHPVKFSQYKLEAKPFILQ